MIKFLKPLSFLPALCLMYMIFTFSAQDGVSSSQLSYKVSYKLIETGGEILGADFEPWEIDSLAVRFNGAIRKIAHMTEYFALAVAVSFPLYVYGLRGIWLMLVAGFICVAFACGDEYHQSYVAGRGPSKRDVLIDSFGVFWGIILVRIIGWTGRKTIFRPFGRKKKTENIEMYPYPNQPYPNQPQGGPAYGNPPFQNQPYAGQPYGNQPYNTNPYPEQPYGNPPYRNPSAGPVSYYPPRGHAGSDREANSYTAPNAGESRGSCIPPNGCGYPQQPYHNKNTETSDRLSEDMSFRKLMHDLKEKKTDKKSHNE